MRNRFSTAAGASDIPGLVLEMAWDVDVGLEYDIHISDREKAMQGPNGKPKTGMIALRNHTGQGRIEIKEQPEVVVEGSCLVFLQWRDVCRYHAVDEAWKFWWFEFHTLGTIHLPFNQPLKMIQETDEPKIFRRIWRGIRSQQSSQRRQATALFQALLYDWLSKHEWPETTSLHTPAIKHLIEIVHEQIEQNWTVKRMAQQVHLSERTFRKAFHDVTGQCPKEFYDELRLATASELLSTGSYTISEVADKLGYSSPFHLSKVFRAKYGFPPSQVRLQNKHE